MTDLLHPSVQARICQLAILAAKIFLGIFCLFSGLFFLIVSTALAFEADLDFMGWLAVVVMFCCGAFTICSAFRVVS